MPLFFLPQQSTGINVNDGIEVLILDKEYEVCMNASQNMWCSSKKGKWGGGLINSEDDKTKAERTGLLGEIAFAKLANLQINVDYCEGGNDEDCLTINGLKIDVKTAAKKPKYKAGLIRAANPNQKLVSLKSDLYVFAYIVEELSQEKICRVVIVGGEYRENIVKRELKKAKVGNHFNYEIKYKELIPIKDLLLLVRGNDG